MYFRAMNTQDALQFQWPYMASFLPDSLDASAFEHGALRRRREITDASTLLRICLAYGFCRLSLREVALWAEAAQLASLSNVALLKRLRASADWLGALVGAKLAERTQTSKQSVLPYTLRLVDATTLSKPGSKGIDWRLHVVFSPSTFSVSQIELTNANGGESLLRFACNPGDLLIADRGYAHRAGLAHVRSKGAHFIVRLNWQNVPLTHLDGTSFDLLAALRTLPEGQARDFPVQFTSISNGTRSLVTARLVATRKTLAAADADRRRILKERRRKGRKIDPRTLEAASYMFVITSLSSDEVTPSAVLELYRFRWQVELVFKRLKSILDVDELPAKQPALARSFILANVLGALLLEDLTQNHLAFSPWGYRLA